ncbi:MAG: AAA family ATPase [Oscillatoriaceae bacterium SKW80]|nr:AAA family ATPase [Oscillatoriaceae bacterium SKYG93]MCX8121497.1 AAA family ATPase [Oscillatoriaceae bacterium SKW80]MDW8452917.1 AAA family ATPase [Oscillatoriaceae cyanobacterium SKYGB_i_bin93]
MEEIAGYIITEKIHESVKTVIYRGRKIGKSKSVIVKIPNTEYPTMEEIIRLKNQYAIAKNLNIPGIIKPLSLEPYKNSLALILEDFEGISLKNYIDKPLAKIEDFLKIAIKIAEILGLIHKNKIIHKDINPYNILINPKTQEVKITDFSISSLLPREETSLINPNVIEGTLAYISPEQTGRMNRGIDYRTDFYSLGVTFYEMLTGRLPFQSTEPIELLHCHIAKQPVPPENHCPKAISDIIIKLMAKTPEQRYQSAKGLKADLETCLYQLETKGASAPFVLGQRDIADRFLIPDKLYGREKEIATLMAAFARIANGAKELMLVAGYSGIGKSSLVREIHKPILQQRGYFISGKFDQFKRDIPFAPLIEAFRSLAKQLLTESQEAIAIWKQQLSTALGNNGQVIIDVIPEIEKIIGQQPPVIELPPEEAQNRFNLIFKQFIRVLATAEHPLVLFLDDLQWADTASLKLIQVLTTAFEIKYFLLIAAYRDNEVSPVHPWMQTAEAIAHSGTTVNKIILQPIDENHLNQLVAEALNCSENRAKPLSELVYRKTQGNPFFATQFLQSIYEQGLLEYVENYQAEPQPLNLDEKQTTVTPGYWQCDIAKVTALAVSENVVEFIASKLKKFLPKNVQEILKIAACIGHKFDLETLATVCEKSQAETAAELWKTLQAGLVLPMSEIYKFFQSDHTLQINSLPIQSPTYKFLHDRVQQAAYSLIPDADKKATHLKIGKLLLKNLEPAHREEKIFEIVNQLNKGADLITSQTERYELAQLNLAVGRKAKTATAAETALRYLKTGLELLAPDCWVSEYDLTLALHLEATEAAYLNGDFEQMEALAQQIENHAKTILDKVKVSPIKIQACVAQNNLLLAVQTALQALQWLGINFPEKPSQSDIEHGLKQTIALLSRKSIEDLIELPEMKEPDKLAAMRIMSAAGAAVYQAQPSLLPLLVFKQIAMSLDYGNAEQSIYVYAVYGLILCGMVEDIESGYQFGKLALKLLSRLDAKKIKARTLLVVSGNVIHWKEHIRETFNLLQEGYACGLETGDLEFASYNAYVFCCYQYFAGKELSEVERDMENYEAALAQIEQKTALNNHKIFRQAVLNLLGRSENPCRLIGESYNEEKMLPLYWQTKNYHAIVNYYYHKLNLCYIFENSRQAIEYSELAKPYLYSISGAFTIPLFYFYDSLARLAVATDAPANERKILWEKVEANQEKMKRWADFAPMNYLDKFVLVEAEKYRILGKYIEAMEAYDRAIALAKEYEYIQEEALANELAAKFYLAWGKEKIAQTYLIDAYYGFIRWGAIAKVRDLEVKYPNLLSRISARKITEYLPLLNSPSNNSIQTISSTAKTNAKLLDLATIMKASTALSEEIVLDKLLSKLMRVILENAGAQKGCLILEKNGQLFVEASVTSDTEEVTVLQSLPVDEYQEIPVAVIHYVERTGERVLLNNTESDSLFTCIGNITAIPKSLLCFPILHKGKRIGILYLENNLSTDVFTAERLEVLKLLSAQAAVSIENALLYQSLQESEARERQKAIQLEQSLHSLQEAQLQLIQSEKMSSLGQLIAGVAHEINNPVSFIHGNISYAAIYSRELIEILRLYQKHYPNPVSEIMKAVEAVDLEYLMEDLPKLLSSMKMGTDRISEIVKSLKNFSRKDTTTKEWANIHQGIDSTLLILSNRLKSKGVKREIKVIKEYGNLPEVRCYPGQLNQVFMNILANAIDALEEYEGAGIDKNNFIANTTIRIRTEVIEGTSVVIRITDNGPGMTPEVQSQLFNTFFTTKPLGKGTGLGLSISYQIVVEKHGGKLKCISAPGEGTEFIIEIPIA